MEIALPSAIGTKQKLTTTRNHSEDSAALLILNSRQALAGLARIQVRFVHFNRASQKLYPCLYRSLSDAMAEIPR